MLSHRIQNASKSAKTFVVAVCAVIVLLEIWSGWRERDVEFQEATRAGSNMALALAQQAGQTFSEVDVVLLGVLEHLENDGVNPEGQLRTHDFMVMHVRKLAQLAGIFVYDEKGNWVVNSQPYLESKFNNSDRDYFQYHKAHRTDKPFIGKPIKSKSTGQWVLTISRRVNKMDGSFGGVVLGTIDLAFLERFYTQFDLGSGGAIMFGDLNGTVLHRRPLLSDSIGKSLENSPLFQQYIKRSVAGSVEIRSTQDGVIRINSFQHLNDYPLFIVAAMSKDDVLKSWTRHIWIRGIGITILLVILSYGGIKMIGLITLREAAEHQAVRTNKKLNELYETLEAQSQRDGLTDIFNRRYFDNALDSESARFRRSGGSMALIMIDIDHFKLFNDTYGHVAGDECLKRTARLISGAVARKNDIVARYGGEEFAIILPDCGKDGAIAVAQMLLKAIRNAAIPHMGSAFGKVTVSIGLVALTAEQSFEVASRKMIEIADEALYQAKHNGRDQVIYRDFPELRVESRLVA